MSDSKTVKDIDAMNQALQEASRQLAQMAKSTDTVRNKMEAMGKVTRGVNQRSVQSQKQSLDLLEKQIRVLSKVTAKAQGGSAKYQAMYSKMRGGVETSFSKRTSSAKSVASTVGSRSGSARVKALAADVPSVKGKTLADISKFKQLGDKAPTGKMGLFSKALGGVGSKFTSLLAVGGKTGRLLAALGPVGVGIAAVLGGIAMAAGAVVGSIMAVYAAFQPLIQNMRIVEAQVVRLKSAFQNAVRGVKEYQKAVEYAGRTPFAVEEITEATASLRTFGIDVFGEVQNSGRKTIDVLGDMAGAMGTDMATAAWALQRALVGEWEIMQNNFQISARMIPQLKGLTSGTHEYGQAIIQYIADQKRFVGGMDETINTIRGLTSNIKDVPSNILIGIGSVDMNRTLLKQSTVYQEVLDSLRKIYDSVSQSDAMTRMSSAFAKIEASGPKAVEALEQFKKGTLSLEEIQTKYLNDIGGLSDKALDGFKDLAAVRGLGMDINEFPDLAKMKGPQREAAIFLNVEGDSNALELAYSRIQRIIHYGQILGQVLKVVWGTVIDPFFSMFAAAIDSVLGGFESWLNGFMPSLKKLSENVSGDVQSITTDTLKKLGISAVGMENDIAKLSEQTNKALRDAGIKGVGPLQKRLLIFTVMMELMKMVIKKILGEIWTTVKNIFGPMITYVQNSIRLMMLPFEIVKDVVIAWAKGIFRAYVDFIWKPLVEMAASFKGMMTPFNGAMGSVVDALYKVWDIIAMYVLPVIEDIAYAVGAFIYAPFMTIFKFMTGVFSALTEPFEELFKVISDILKPLMEVNTQAKEFTVFSDAIKKYLLAPLGYVAKMIGFVVGTVLGWLVKALTWVIKTLWDNREAIMSFVQTIWTYVGPVASFLLDVLLFPFKLLWNILSYLVGKVVDFFSSFSSGEDSAESVGWLSQTFSLLSEAVSTVATYLSDLWSRFTSGEGTIGKFGSMIFSVFQRAWDIIKAVMKTVQDFMDKILSGDISGAFSGLWDGIKNIGGMLLDALAEIGPKIVEWWDSLDLGQMLEDALKPDWLKSDKKDIDPKTGKERLFYGSMNTREGLTNIHKGEMVIPAKYASVIRKGMFGIDDVSPDAKFGTVVNRAVTRPQMPGGGAAVVNRNYVSQDSIVFNVKGDMSKKTAEETFKLYTARSAKYLEA